MARLTLFFCCMLLLVANVVCVRKDRAWCVAKNDAKAEELAKYVTAICEKKVFQCLPIYRMGMCYPKYYINDAAIARTRASYLLNKYYTGTATTCNKKLGQILYEYPPLAISGGVIWPNSTICWPSKRVIKM